MAISIEEVRRIALLARLSLTEEETVRFANDLSAILEYAESINELNTADVKPTSHAIEMDNVWREDEPATTLDRDVVLSQAPQSDETCFVAPRII